MGSVGPGGESMSYTGELAADLLAAALVRCDHEARAISGVG